LTRASAPLASDQGRQGRPWSRSRAPAGSPTSREETPTFLGQGGLDFGSGIAVDRHGDAYVAGFTQSAGFPTTQGAFDTTFNGDEDAFVTKLGLGTRRLDHFKCYTARSRATGKPRWVTLRDQFGTKRALVGPPARLGNPVSKNRQG
jgi:Beta-propeller repeat